MPAEQLGGTVDATSDLYALGATLLHAATGKAPSELLTSDMALRVPRDVPLRELIARLVQPRREKRIQSAAAALEELEHPSPRRQVRPRFALLAAFGLAVTALSFAWTVVPASTEVHAAVTLPGGGSAAQRWFASAKPFCNPVEVAQFMARRPGPAGWDGAGYAAGCWALAGRIEEARSALARVPKEDRRQAAGVVFNLAHPVADAGDDVAAGPIMNLVLESSPNHFMALYHAGMSDSALGHGDRARTHLTEFLRIYKTDDGFTQNARTALAKLR
jgi:hypothetical protein